MKYLVEDVRQFAEKIGGKNKKFVLVAHDWGANVAWAFAMYHPEMLEKLSRNRHDLGQFLCPARVLRRRALLLRCRRSVISAGWTSG
jgi:pimeloyl-ACP methyl ester carboxylesterase